MKKIKFRKRLLVTFLLFILSSHVFSYDVDWKNVNGGGNERTSGNYNIYDAIGQNASGTIQGTNFGISPTGFVLSLFDTIPPNSPTGLVAISGDSKIDLSWTANTESDLAGYNVYRSTIQAGTYTKAYTTLITTNKYTDTGLTNGATYWYKITAVDIAGNESSFSTAVSCTPIHITGGLANSAWPTFMQNLKRNGQSPYAGPPTVDINWGLYFAESSLSSPIMGTDGTIYVGGAKLHAVNTDGMVKWEFSTTEWFYTPTIGKDGTIYINSSKKLYAINPDGTKKWEFIYSGSSSGSPAISADGTIYSQDGKYLYAINPNGSKKWQVDLWYISSFASPAVDDNGIIYVSAYGGKVFAIYPDGTKKWESVLNTADLYYSGTPALANDGTIYVNTKNLYAIDKNGNRKWILQGQFWGSSPPAIDKYGIVYVGSDDKKLYAVNPDGTKKWEFQTNYYPSSPIVDNTGTIYFGSDKIYALNPDGTAKWIFTSGDYSFSPPSIDSDGNLYIASSTLYAFRKINLPSKPTNLVAQGDTANVKITLNWDISIQGTYPITGYNVYRPTTQNGHFEKININLVTNNNYVDNKDNSLSSPQNGVTYYYKVSAVDSMKNESEKSEVASAASIVIIPQIYHSQIISALTNTLLSINAEVIDETGVASVKLYYRKTGTTQFTSADMAKDGNTNNYAANIPAASITTAGVQYYIEAKDIDTPTPHTSYAPITAQTTPFTVTVGDTFSATVKVIDKNGFAVVGANVVHYKQGKQYAAYTTDNKGEVAISNLALGDELYASKISNVKSTQKGSHPDNIVAAEYIDNYYLENDNFKIPKITSPGPQTLVLNHSLTKFNLIISLEWKANADFLNKLKKAVWDASNYMFDATDGQMSIGRVDIYDSKQKWYDADIWFYAKEFWPRAAGGTISASSGHIYMGSTYFDTGYLGPPNRVYTVIIHEFGHYGFFLLDEYLLYGTVWQNNADCTADINSKAGQDDNASIMDSDWSTSEFCTPANHNKNQDSMQQHFYGKSTWEVIKDNYPWVSIPSVVNPGPHTNIGTEIYYNGVKGKFLTSFSAFDLNLTVTDENGNNLNNVSVYLSNEVDPLMEQGNRDAGVNDGRVKLLGVSVSDHILVFKEGYENADVTVSGAANDMTIKLKKSSTKAAAGVEIKPKSSGSMDIALMSENLKSAPVIKVVQKGNTAFTTLTTNQIKPDTFSAEMQINSFLENRGTIVIEGADSNGQKTSDAINFEYYDIQSDKDNMIQLSNNVGLFVPAGAIDFDTRIVTNSTPISQSMLKDGLAPVGQAQSISIGEDAKVVGEIILTMNYDPSLVEENNVAIYSWDNVAEKWVRLGGVVAAELRTVSVKVNHLSLFSVFTADTMPPSVNVITPKNNETISPVPSISATVDDKGGSLLDSSKIQVKIDGNVVSHKYDAATGTVNYKPSSPLSDGEHGLNISASDNVGNVSDASIKFNVKDELELNQLHNYPNPMKNQGTTFKYFLTGDADVLLELYDFAGDRVCFVSGLPGAGGKANEYYWNDIINCGHQLANGAYIYRVTAHRGDKKVSKTGKLLILR